MSKYKLAVKLAKMLGDNDENRMDFLEEKMTLAVYIFDTLDNGIDTYIKTLKDKLWRSKGRDYDVETDSFTLCEWDTIYLIRHLEEYRDELQAHTDIR